MTKNFFILFLIFSSLFILSGSSAIIYAVDTDEPDVTLGSFPEFTSDNTPTVTGLAEDEENEVEAVQFKVGSGSWNECAADDGAFDEDEENFTCTVSSALSDGEYEILVRGRDSLSNVAPSGEEESVEFTIDTIAPTTPGILTPSSYCEDCDEPALIFRKASDGEDGSGIQNYSVYLDEGKHVSYGTTGIPSGGQEEESEEEWKSDGYVTVTFYNEHDDSDWNDEIWVEFAGLEKQRLSAGKHSWRVKANDKAGNESNATTDFYIDDKLPRVSEAAVADVAVIAPGREYKLKSTMRTPSFSGKITDYYGGSTLKNNDGSQDVFDSIASGPKKVTLLIQKVTDPKLLQKSNVGTKEEDDEEDDENDADTDDAKKTVSPFKQYATRTVTVAKIDDVAKDNKSGRFFITTPHPLENGYYRVSIFAEDTSGNDSNQITFYLSLNYRGVGIKSGGNVQGAATVRNRK